MRPTGTPLAKGRGPLTQQSHSGFTPSRKAYTCCEVCAKKQKILYQSVRCSVVHNGFQQGRPQPHQQYNENTGQSGWSTTQP